MSQAAVAASRGSRRFRYAARWPGYDEGPMSPSEFMQACVGGDVAALRDGLVAEPGLVFSRDEGGRTCLHFAIRHPDTVLLLLEHGADVNARERGDNATPLHVAAAHGVLESVRILLDAGADVHGAGDLHESDVIGWAVGSRNQAVTDLLVERGARHHIFSAMASGDHDLVRRVVSDNPAALHRRRSRFENGQTAVHAAVGPADGVGFLCGRADHAMLALLIELGADVNATDDRGRTPLTLAMLRGDHVAMRMLVAAGAVADTDDAITEGSDVAAPLAALSVSVSRAEPMFSVRDMSATVRWYQSIGFTCIDTYEDEGTVTLARLVFGRCSFAIQPGAAVASGVSLWVFTSRIERDLPTRAGSPVARRTRRALGRTWRPRVQIRRGPVHTVLRRPAVQRSRP